MTLGELLRQGREALADPVDTQFLLMDLFDLPHSALISQTDRPMSESEVQRFQEAVGRRQQGEPIAYITGRRGFWTLDLHVTQDTLIPRPETEMLVELALEHGANQSGLRILDLCTGSGAVALAIASERPDWEVTGTDIAEATLAVAQANAKHIGLDNVRFLLGDLYAPVAQSRFDIIVANPPYISAEDPHLSQGDLRHEPKLALAAGQDGLDILRPLIARAGEHLLPGGRLLVEHGYDQRDAILTLAAETLLVNRRDLDDLAGQPRVFSAEM